MRLPLLLTLIGLAVGQDERICDSRVNGLYAVGPCSPNYDHCYNGIPVRKSCGDGLVFNPDNDMCDYEGNVKGCDNRMKMSCLNKKDGFYTIGCSSTYFSCVNGEIVNKSVGTCQNGLFYDSERNTCDHKFRVRACGGNPEIQREPVRHPPLVLATFPPNLWEQNRRSIHTARIRGRGHHHRPSTSCHGKADGPHPVSSCSQQYITCANATSQLAECPDFQVFSSAEHKCVPMKTAQECSGQSHTSDIDCSFKEDGYYGIGCTSSFVFCSGGKALAMECPNSLVFNERKGYCDYKESCAGVSSSGAAAAVHTQPIGENSKSVSTSFCSLRKDGFYSEGCTQDFISCDHGHATSMKCPDGLVFNQERGYCDHRESCSEQHAKPSLSANSMSGSATVESPGLKHSSHLEVTQKAESASTVDCAGRRDGYYSEGCTPEFTFCNDGIATPLRCPSSLVFNMNKLRCDYVESCVAEAPGVTTSAPVRAPPGVTAFSCDGKAKGYYSNGCTPNYVFCNEGIATAMRCPSSLVFNQKKGLCDYPEECLGEVKIPTAEALSQPQQHSTSPQSQTVVSPVDCKGKEDGYYSSGCTAQFVFCSAGSSTTMQCPAGLVFNERKGNCDYLESCTSEAAPSVLEKTASVVETAAPVLTAAHESTIDCKTKANGYYALGCSSSYFHCNDGILTTLKCPASLVYNEDEGRCDYPEKSCKPNPHQAHVRPEMTVRHESVQVVTTAEREAAHVSIDDKMFDCNGKKDGFYSRGCAKTYVYCENGSATTMNCPHTLVFNERKGRCDYLESCQAEVKTSSAASPTFIAPAPTVELPKPAAQESFECKGKPNGYYSLGCTPDYFACVEGVATAMMCPTNMVFNEKKVACDYLENCLEAPVAASSPLVTTSSVQDVVQHTTSQTTLEIDCAGKKNGYYSNGCSSTFVLCNEGVAVTMKCPPTLVFDEKKGHCDYMESCSKNSVGHTVLPAETVASKTAVPRPQPVPAPAPDSRDSKSVLAHAKSDAIDVDCAEKKDGYYSSGCTPNFVFCSGGVATSMTCPPTLVYNPQKGRCDYSENCSVKVEEQPSPKAMSSTLAQPSQTAPVADASPPVSQQETFDCKGRMDGFYSNGCSPIFYFCNEGVATPMKCPSSLVFNAKKGHCDYVENCSVEIPAPAKDTSTSSSPPTPSPAAPAPSGSSQVNCAGKKDGYYSNGCTSEFVLCSKGTATTMKCPPTLVFDEKKGHCDYVENCAHKVPPTLAPAPVLPSPPLAASMVKETVEHAHSTATFPVNCAGKKDGYYSNGCSAEFVFCSEGIATVMKCPNTLVFNERKGSCDYVENCSEQGQKQPSMTVALPTVPQESLKAEKRMDCSGKSNGYYSDGCTAEFYLCSEGIAVTMQKCPTPLVFNQKKGQCDYLENCNSVPSPLPLASTVSHKAQAALVSDVVDCVGKPNGYYANGCSPSFAYCLDGVATPMRCPPSLVFDQSKGQCDFAERCLTKVPLPGTAPVPHQPPVPVVQRPFPAPVVQQPAPAPVVQQPAPAPVVQRPAPAPVVQQPAAQHAVHHSTVVPIVQQAAHENIAQHSGSLTASIAHPQSASSFDCSGKVDGFYSNGCSPEFVSCAGGVATLMKCPASLVFSAKKGHCDYLENCSGQPSRPVPTQSSQSAAAGSLDCSGKMNGFYSNGCHSDFVQCSNGVAIKMKCPQPLVFNEKNGYCDYLENCSEHTQPHLSPSVTPAPLEPTLNKLRFECAGRSDGYHSNGCTSDFVYCHGGVATAMKCPASLVFNEEKGYCDYMENCIEKNVPVAVPTHVPTQSAPSHVPTHSAPTILLPTQQQAQAPSGTLDCAGRPNGHYSKGCSNDFVFCNDGVATAMKCPSMLVFNEKNGYCDYPESCQAGGAAVVHKPPITQQSPPLSSDLTCFNREDGYYSDGCSSEFVYCFEGKASYFKCPAGLVYDEKAGYCDYSENCGGGSEAESVLKPSKDSTVTLTSAADEHRCKGRPDGYYSDGCSPEFNYCSDGVATRMRCPSTLVFNQEMNYCDYPEVCSPQEEQSNSAAASPSKPQISFVCPESTGVFSLGCTSEFVVCSHDVAQVMTCPEGLVFNFAKKNCDHKDKCHEGKKDKPAADTSASAGAEPSTSRISSECKNLPDGMYGSHCGTSFVVCANGVAYTMNCPSDLVFDAKTNRCVFSKDCGEKAAGKKHGKATAALHRPQTTRNDCIGKPDGLHSLGCVGEFLQCVGGKTYSLHCPAGLVFVEQLGVCDEPSTCKQLHRPKNVSSPLAYEPIVSSIPEDTECEAEGYFAHFCSVEFYNCVHGKVFVGKCPGGLVFNPDKAVCENVESCAGIKESKQHSPITLTVPKTEFSQDNSCKDRPDGVISDLDCQPHFTTCLAGTAFVTKCPAGLVYSLKAKLCDYPNVCEKGHHSSVAPAAEPTRTVAVHYQDTAVGKDLCAGKASGPLEHSNCRSSFSFCVHGALYTMNCAPGLLFSFVSHRCEWPSMCSIAPKNTEPVVPPASHQVLITTSRDFLKAVRFTDYDCTSLPDGNYQIGECVGRFVMCSNGRAYVQFCPSGLVFNSGKGLCDYECGSQAAASPTEDECVSSQALRPCSSKFRRCSNGKLVPAQCPGSATFNEALSSCVYDQPECVQEAPLSNPVEYEPTYQIPHVHPLRKSFTPVVSQVASHSPYLPVQPPYVHPFPPQIQFLPMTVSDDFYRREKINKGTIPFEKRPMIADRHRHLVKDVFDGHASPYLIRGIDRIFVPHYKKHRKHGRDRDRSECGGSQDCSDEQDVNVRRLFGDDLHNVELPVPIEVGSSSQVQTAKQAVGAVNARPSFQTVSHQNGNGVVEDIPEGSGQEVTRRKRSSTVAHKAKHDFSMCTAKSTSEFVSLGHCHQDFVICRAAGAGLRAACPVGDLFDAQLNKCVSSQFCGEGASYDEPLLQEQKEQDKQVITASTTATRRRKPPIYRPRKRLGHTAHHKPSTHSRLEHSRPVHVHPVPIPQPRPVPHTNGSPSPSFSKAQLPYDCSTNMDYALDCSGNYVRCANGIAHRMKCPQGLVFDQTRQYCDYPQHVAGCSTSQAPSLLPQPKPYPYRPEEEQKLLRPALQSALLPHPANRPDLCTSSPDGLLGEGCTASFIICAGGRMQASMNCPAGTFFDGTRKTCDFKERVVACGGSLDEPIPSVHSPVVARTTTPASVRAHGCAAPLQPLGRCSSKFVVCSDGKLSEFHCSNPLVFNPLTITCDFREFVSECAEYKGADAPTSTQVVTTTVHTTTTTEPPKCVFNEKRQAFALDYCARKYGLCSKRGVLERAQCNVGFLFDAHLNTCVPAEQCGQRKLEAVLSKVTIAPPKAAALVDNAEAKIIRKKDERCRDSADGTTKSLGRCRSTYLRCVGGEAHIEPCPAAEVFCAVSNTCVPRDAAPECHAQRKIVHNYASASVESNDVSMFCKVRSDGLYRNPSDCAGILQCFGGDVYEYPPCSSGLVFNEAKSKCDYRDAVPECKLSAAVADEVKGCRGANHGELIPHESNCQYFYRCSWNHLEKMHCPSGTVFNPDLSVCDYPANVPQCAKRR